MQRPTPHKEKDAKAVLIGGLLILLVGGYFIGRAFFFKESSSENSETEPLTETNAQKESGAITPEVVRKKLLNKEPIKFVDIRSREAFDQEHIPQSIWLSPGGLNGFVPEKDDIVVIIYNELDEQSLEVAKNIIQQKSFNAFFLEGGFEGWKRTNNQTVSSGDPNSFIDQSKVVYINAAELGKLLANPEMEVFLLDVQSQSNYQKVHLKNAKNIPLEDLEKRNKEIPSGTTIVVYGENELISFKAGVRLADMNVFTAKTLSGNKNLTAESGLPLEPEQK